MSTQPQYQLKFTFAGLKNLGESSQNYLKKKNKN